MPSDADSPKALALRSKRLEALKRRFIALTLRSRALRLTRTTRSGALDLHRLKVSAPEGFQRLIDVLGRDHAEPIPLCEAGTGTGDDPLADDLRTLARAAKLTWMETGAQQLAVGWPLLEGRCRDGTWLRGPLWLYPVTLATTRTGRMMWAVEPLGPPDFNEALAKTLHRSEGARMDAELFLKHDDDGLFCWDDGTWAGMNAALRAAGVPLVVEETQLLPPLVPLRPRTRQDRDSAPRGAFALRQHLVLGRFPRASSHIASEYERLLEEEPTAARLGAAADLLLVDETAIQSPVTGPGRPLDEAAVAPTSDALDGGAKWHVFPSDGSQDHAIRFGQDGQAAGLVVQGPPGTGKSQMISNLIAVSIAEGKRVLLVCQKRAALDVVARRLASRGLEEPLALVHDVQRDRNAVCASIVQSCDHAATLGPAGARDAGADQADAARRHARALERVRARLSAAQDVYRVMAGRHPGVPGLAELHERQLSDDGRSLPDLSGRVADLTETALHGALPRAEALARETRQLATPHPLALRSDWADVDDKREAEVFDELAALCDLLAELSSITDGVQTPGEALDDHQAHYERSAPLLDLCERGDPDEIAGFLLAWVWTSGRVEHGPWHRVMRLLQKGAETLEPTPVELCYKPLPALEEWIERLDELSTLRARWDRFFRPTFWRLREMPREILAACTGLDELPPEVRGDALSLCKRAVGWRKLIGALPTDDLLETLTLTGRLESIQVAIEEQLCCDPIDDGRAVCPF